MKKLGVSLLVGLTFAMLLFGCGKEKAEEETVPATEETAESLPVETESETETETVAEDVPPEEGMVRSSLTNEWISGDIASVPLQSWFPTILPLFLITAFPKRISCMNVL